MQEHTGDPAAPDLLRDFAEITGLDPVFPHPHRYLWTDAFAVCTYLQIFRDTGDGRYRDLALRLVNQVHDTLGRHRADDSRQGWISGLSEEEGRLHPTAGGLRIGKPLPERTAGEACDERREWDQDGQYYHYLTRWMHALERVAAVTGTPGYLQWALELAQGVHRAFTYQPEAGGRRRMYWKMSIDLSRPLVRSMGQHDALDGYVTYRILQAARKGAGLHLPDLQHEVRDMAGICHGGGWVTDDPLGIGGLLSDATWISRLMVPGDEGDRDLLEDILDAALPGLGMFSESGCLQIPADHRLAFRELGLALGLAGVEQMLAGLKKDPERYGRGSTLPHHLRSLAAYLPMGQAIRGYWRTSNHRQARTWSLHREINTVMLAAALSPGEYLSV